MYAANSCHRFSNSSLALLAGSVDDLLEDLAALSMQQPKLRRRQSGVEVDSKGSLVFPSPEINQLASCLCSFSIASQSEYFAVYHELVYFTTASDIGISAYKLIAQPFYP